MCIVQREEFLILVMAPGEEFDHSHGCPEPVVELLAEGLKIRQVEFGSASQDLRILGNEESGVEHAETCHDEDHEGADEAGEEEAERTPEYGALQGIEQAAVVV